MGSAFDDFSVPLHIAGFAAGWQLRARVRSLHCEAELICFDTILSEIKLAPLVARGCFLISVHQCLETLYLGWCLASPKGDTIKNTPRPPCVPGWWLQQQKLRCRERWPLQRSLRRSVACCSPPFSRFVWWPCPTVIARRIADLLNLLLHSEVSFTWQDLCGSFEQSPCLGWLPLETSPCEALRTYRNTPPK